MITLADVQARREAAYDAGFDKGSDDGWSGNVYDPFLEDAVAEDQEYREGYRHGYGDGLSAYRRTLEG